MANFKNLVSAFGWDKNAVDLAGDLNASWSKANVQKILNAMKARNVFYRGPRRLMYGFSMMASKVFKGTRAPTPQKIGLTNTPFVD